MFGFSFQFIIINLENQSAGYFIIIGSMSAFGQLKLYKWSNSSEQN